MPWVKIDERLSEHPKVVGLSNKSFRVHINALCYCNRNLTDGMIPAAVLAALGGGKRTAEELVDATLWEKNGAGWKIHDYLEYNPARQDVERTRQERSKAGSKGAAKRWHDDDL